jgi:hypothetical protein
MCKKSKNMEQNILYVSKISLDVNCVELKSKKMSKNPQTLYANCLNCYVKGLNYNVQTLDNISQTRLLLPPVVLADIYFKVSRKSIWKSLSSPKVQKRKWNEMSSFFFLLFFFYLMFLLRSLGNYLVTNELVLAGLIRSILKIADAFHNFWKSIIVVCS